MAPTRIVLVPAGTMTTRRVLIPAAAPLAPSLRAVGPPPSTSFTPSNHTKRDSTSVSERLRPVDPMALLNPVPVVKTRKRERLTALTPEEKMQRRKMKNRVAAQTARDRKKERTNGLEYCVKDLLEENDRLRTENELLVARIERLEADSREQRAMLQQLQQQQNQNPQPTTAPLQHAVVAALGSAEGSGSSYGVPGGASGGAAGRFVEEAAAVDAAAPILSSHEVDQILSELGDFDVDEMCASLYDSVVRSDTDGGCPSTSSPASCFYDDEEADSPSRHPASTSSAVMIMEEEEWCGEAADWSYDPLLQNDDDALQHDYDPVQLQHGDASPYAEHSLLGDGELALPLSFDPLHDHANLIRPAPLFHSYAL